MSENSKVENYEVELSIAREYPRFSLHLNNTVEQIRDWKSIPDVYVNNVLAIMEFGHIDIELHVYEEGPVYQFYVRTAVFEDYDEWEWLDGGDTLDLSDFSEELMYTKLMEYAKKHSVSWSEINHEYRATREGVVVSEAE